MKNIVSDFHHWNYRIIKDKGNFEVREVYYDKYNEITSWTSGPSILSWEELGELLGTYKLIGSAFEKPILEIFKDKLVEMKD
jgi:hypothetical protein